MDTVGTDLDQARDSSLEKQGGGTMTPKPTIGWLVIGGWSGKRPLRPEVVESAQSIVRVCKALGVPVFVKDNMRADYIDKDEWPQEIPK